MPQPGVYFDASPIYEGLASAGRALDRRAEREFQYGVHQDELAKDYYSLGLHEQARKEDAARRGTVIQEPGPFGTRIIRNLQTGAMDIVKPPVQEPALGSDPTGTGNYYWTGSSLAHASAAAAPKQTEADVTFQTNAKVALQKLDELEAVLEKYGNFENLYGNAEARAKLGQIPYDVAVLTSKIVDPATAAREGEVEAQRKYGLPMGFWTPDDVTKEAIKSRRELIGRYIKERGAAKGEAPPSGGGAVPSRSALLGLPSGGGGAPTGPSLFGSPPQGSPGNISLPGMPRGKPLDAAAAQRFHKLSGGNRALAEKLAREAGYSF
ncbi:MAG TPA: hypothetical protein VGP99_00155 [Tepidisphaeraceae bacterium]|jgi:hypothetical protein|nr:hypothetical protein [Tepidisphaeraceae bacterium]